MSEQDAYNLQIKTHRHTKFIEKWVLAGGVCACLPIYTAHDSSPAGVPFPGASQSHFLQGNNVDQPSGTITLKVKEGTMAHLYPPSCKVLLHLIYGLRWRTVDRTEMHAWSVIRTRVNIIAIINGTPTKRTKAM
jgi:hypothetical protein